MGLAVVGEIFEELSAFGVPDDGAQRHWEYEVLRRAAFLILAFTVLTSLGVVMLLVTKIEKRGKLAVSPQGYVPALSSVAAVGPAPGNVFFTPKAEAAVSSVSGFDEDFRFIDEFDRSTPAASPGGWLASREKFPQTRAPSTGGAYTLTFWRFRSRRSNVTMPSILAKRVKSLPNPTLAPGWMRVPFCRTKMEPAWTICPPYRFTPSLWPALSRPFRELPCPFLCAMKTSQIQFKVPRV
jgi:hypothetical protein